MLIIDKNVKLFLKCVPMAVGSFFNIGIPYNIEYGPSDHTRYIVVIKKKKKSVG